MLLGETGQRLPCLGLRRSARSYLPALMERKTMPPEAPLGPLRYNLTPSIKCLAEKIFVQAMTSELLSNYPESTFRLLGKHSVEAAIAFQESVDKMQEERLDN